MSSAFVMSATNGTTSWPDRAAISRAARSTSARVRAQMATRQPSAESASAEPRPSPFDAAVTSAILPLIPRSIDRSSVTVCEAQTGQVSRDQAISQNRYS